MDTKGIPPELIDRGMRAADSALLSAIFKRVCGNNPEIARLIVEDASKLLPTDSGFAGEDSVGLIAKHVLANKLKTILAELETPSGIADGVQRTVNKGY